MSDLTRANLQRHPLRWAKQLGIISCSSCLSLPVRQRRGHLLLRLMQQRPRLRLKGRRQRALVLVVRRSALSLSALAMTMAITKPPIIGSQAVEEAFPDMEVFRAENVPENQEAERVMENMIRSGAKIIFPTSYGHLDPALEVAARHPEVIFMHQGGLKTAENLGTYFGTIWEAVYLSGVAAGHMSETGKLGYIVAFPIPQVLAQHQCLHIGRTIG